jgi:hypothetical protein
MNNTLKSKNLYKLLLVVLKGLPMVMALGFVISNTIPRINPVLNMIVHICGLTIPQFAFMYLSSYIFRFCSYHRIFLHYILAIQAITVTDWYIGIPISNNEIRYLQYAVSVVFAIIAIYLYIKHRIDMKKSRPSES